MTLSIGKMIELRAQFGGKCEYCGNQQELDFVHIMPTKLSGRNGRGSAERYRDIKDNPQCYVLLCKKHHNMQHLFDVLVKHPELKRRDMNKDEIFSLGEFIEKRRTSCHKSSVA